MLTKRYRLLRSKHFLNPLCYLAGHTHQRIYELLIDIHVAFVLGQIALAMRLVEHAPLFVGKVNGVLQA